MPPLFIPHVREHCTYLVVYHLLFSLKASAMSFGIRPVMTFNSAMKSFILALDGLQVPGNLSFGVDIIHDGSDGIWNSGESSWIVAARLMVFR